MNKLPIAKRVQILSMLCEGSSMRSISRVCDVSINTVGKLQLETVNLEGETDFGVYIIWHAGDPSRVVRVGQGDIAARLTTHRGDSVITNYRRFGTLYVTWAVVSPRLVDGVERHLAEHWKPLVGDRFPNVAPIAVNSPF